MDATSAYAPRNRDIASEDFDGEFVVLDLGSGHYFSLTGGSAVVWKGLLAGLSPQSLCAGLSAGDARRDDVARLVDEFLASELIVATGPASAAADPAIAAELLAVAGPFTVEMFDDLADLLMADPIHDVDQEAGWPHLPEPRN